MSKQGLEETRWGRFTIAVGCVAIVAACEGIESLVDPPWVYPVLIVHYLAALFAVWYLIAAALGPRIMPPDDDDPRPWDVG